MDTQQMKISNRIQENTSIYTFIHYHTIHMNRCTHIFYTQSDKLTNYENINQHATTPIYTQHMIHICIKIFTHAQTYSYLRTPVIIHKHPTRGDSNYNSRHSFVYRNTYTILHIYTHASYLYIPMDERTK